MQTAEPLLLCVTKAMLCALAQCCYTFFSLQFFYIQFYVPFNLFTHIEKNQSVGGAKTGVSREKRTGTPASRLGLSHMARAPSEAQTHSGEKIEVSDLLSATGPPILN